MQVGDILRKKTARVATVRMNETVAIAAQFAYSRDGDQPFQAMVITVST